MDTLRSSQLAALAVLGLLSVSCSDRTDPTATALAPRAAVAAVNPQPRPFQGTLTGMVIWANGPCEPWGARTGSVVQGEVTHLGRTSANGSHCASADGSHALDGHMTFTAANGDQLIATYTAAQVPAPPPPPLMAVEEGMLVITGGTGRFQGATGQVPFTVRVVINSPVSPDMAWPAVFSFAGTIKY